MKDLLDMLQIAAPNLENFKNLGPIMGMAGTGLVGAGTGIMIDRFKSYIEEMRRDKLENRLPLPTEIITGYKMSGIYKLPIVFDMKLNPHLLVCGLSQQGKTSMVEYAIKNKRCVLLNTFDHNFLSINPMIRANTMEEMEKTLKYLVEEMNGNTEPIFVVIDEILEMVLAGSKDITKHITRLLATAAHNYIYVIAISQAAEKEVVKFKNLFNTRVCFKMADETNYKTCLGWAPENPELKRREFYYTYDGRGQGMTYDI